jgi:hypothetical protein
MRIDSVGYYSRPYKRETKQRWVVVCLRKRPALAENWRKTALDLEVLERNVAPKTVISEIEESDKPVLRR